MSGKTEEEKVSDMFAEGKITREEAIDMMAELARKRAFAMFPGSGAPSDGNEDKSAEEVSGDRKLWWIAVVIGALALAALLWFN